MRICVAYDSTYGNTRLVAMTIADQAKAEGHVVRVVNLPAERGVPSDADVLFVGSPTHMRTMTRTVAHFVKKLDRGYWSHRRVVAFDTYGPIATTETERREEDPWVNSTAAGHIQELGRSLGLAVSPKALRCPVTGFRGPLVPEALEDAKRFVHQVLTEGLLSVPTGPEPGVGGLPATEARPVEAH